MAVEITAYGVAWNFSRSEGVVRLRGSDGKTWNSPPLDASAIAAIAAVLRDRAQAGGGWLFSGNEKPAATPVEGVQPFGGENPFPW